VAEDAQMPVLDETTETTEANTRQKGLQELHSLMRLLSLLVALQDESRPLFLVVLEFQSQSSVLAFLIVLGSNKNIWTLKM
jgi:hypothetical protein